MAHHHLPTSDLLSYERKGFLVCRKLLPERDVATAAAAVESVARQRRLDALRHRVRVLVSKGAAARVQTEAEAERLLKRESSDGVGFFQHFNLHRGGNDNDEASEAVRALAFAPALVRTAAALLGADDASKKVRLYQSCAFVKEPGHGQTNWHSDARQCPLDTNDFLTAWIPLRPIGGGAGDSGLVFAAGSHRDFALPFWRTREELEATDLSDRGYELCPQGAMAVGDASFHHGWLLHAAGGQPRGSLPRAALAVSYFLDGARVRADGGGSSRRGEDEDAESVAAWIREVKPCAAARHPLLPVVYDGAKAGAAKDSRGSAAAGGRRGGRGGGRSASGGGGRGGGGRGGGGRGRGREVSAASVPQR
jgi:ectoine hydroxylase-related dioxygenase (phytanoyl-CoA dioxygenase family)